MTPARPLEPHEIEPSLTRADAFAAEHGIRLGIQVSPEHLHDGLLAALDARGWRTQWPTLVMTGLTGSAPATARLRIDDHASPAWLTTWGACEGRADIRAHAQTVFSGLRGRAWFARLGDDAVAIAVPGDGLLGLFCIAVAPHRRRSGLGRAIVSALCALAPQALPYLQVEARNLPAIALYERLGFTDGLPVSPPGRAGLNPAAARWRTRPRRR